MKVPGCARRAGSDFVGAELVSARFADFLAADVYKRQTQRFPPCSDVPSYSGVTTTSDIIPREHENINHGSWGQLSRERSHNMSSPGIALTVFFGLLSLVLSLILYSRAGRRKRLTLSLIHIYNPRPSPPPKKLASTSPKAIPGKSTPNGSWPAAAAPASNAAAQNPKP